MVRFEKKKMKNETTLNVTKEHRKKSHTTVDIIVERGAPKRKHQAGTFNEDNTSSVQRIFANGRTRMA